MGLVVSRETQHMGVPYYVDKGFEKVYRGASLDELEKTIESDYIEHLQNGCWKEKQQSKQAFDVFYSAATGMCSVAVTERVLTVRREGKHSNKLALGVPGRRVSDLYCFNAGFLSSGACKRLADRLGT